MRFDDRIATVLSMPADRADRTSARWRQLVDLLAQPGADSTERDEAFRVLRDTRAAIDPAARRQAARALAGREVAPDLLAFFAEDQASIAAPLIARARLDRDSWFEVLPRLGPAARALLRHRDDLDPEVKHALSAFGPGDLVLERGDSIPDGAPVSAPEATDESDSQIRDLVARIEAFRKQRRQPPGEGPHPVEAHLDGFRWETGSDGVILWVEGAPRGALVGQSIASIAGRGHYGVDGQAAGAFEKRAPFRDARFNVAGAGPAGGDWRISGVPYFDPQRGNFLGYRGTARRPRIDEVANNLTKPVGVFGTELPAESLRQLIHELRTPLNAIIGFAEMIEGQYLGPAAAPYRDNAAEIAGQARSLLGAVEDLDTAARLETRRFEVEDSRIDAASLFARMNEAYGRLAEERGAHLAAEIVGELPPVLVAPGVGERMVSRLLGGAIGLARPGETISTSLGLRARGEGTMLCLTVGRPEAIAGVNA